MASAKAQAADKRTYSPNSENTPGHSSCQEPEPLDVLFVAKRATARQLLDTLPNPSNYVGSLSDATVSATIGGCEHIHLTIVSTQQAALRRLSANAPCAVLVEVEDDPRSRLEFCRTLRAREPAMLILAVGSPVPERVFPFDERLYLPLTADRTAQTIERLISDESQGGLSLGPFQLNTVSRVVSTPSGTHSLTPKLTALLELLMRRHDEVISRSDIMEAIWDTSYLEDTRTLDVHIRWLRQRIEPDPSSPRYLLTKRGEGYYLRVDG